VNREHDITLVNTILFQMRQKLIS